MGVGGSKVRKFTSLIWHIQQNQYDVVVLEGSLYSNNILGLAPLLASYQIPFKVACPTPKSKAIGNRIWLELLIESDQFIDPAHDDEPEAHYCSALGVEKVFVIKEGGKQIESIYGLLSLASEIHDYSKAHSVDFDRIFIDSGSGTTAIGLLIGLELLEVEYNELVVTLIAGTEKEFHMDLKALAHSFAQRENLVLDVEKMRFKCAYPVSAKSFGSINSTSTNAWLATMKELKFPMDYLYTSKHWSAVRQYCEKTPSPLPQLFINSGSWLASRNHESQLVEIVTKKA